MELVRASLQPESDVDVDISPYQPPALPPQPPAAGGTDDALLRMLVPVGRSPYAIAAGYLGLFSLAFCFLGPVAVVLGMLAIRDMRKNPHLTGLPRAILGIVLGLVGTVGFAAVIVFALLS
jgi:hypothetical protein